MSPAEREAFWQDLGRPATDDEVRQSAARMMVKHRRSLQRLAKPEPPQPDAHLGAVGGE